MCHKKVVNLKYTHSGSSDQQGQINYSCAHSYQPDRGFQCSPADTHRFHSACHTPLHSHSQGMIQHKPGPSGPSHTLEYNTFDIQQGRSWPEANSPFNLLRLSYWRRNSVKVHFPWLTKCFPLLRMVKLLLTDLRSGVNAACYYINKRSVSLPGIWAKLSSSCSLNLTFLKCHYSLKLYYAALPHLPLSTKSPDCLNVWSCTYCSVAATFQLGAATQ